MNRLLIVFYDFLILLAGVTAVNAAPDHRVALVIGNGAYKNTIELPNAPNDARAVSAALKRLGFVVVEGEDLTQVAMNDKLKEFSRALSGADLGIVFYAGHGMQVAGENYLVPVDAVLKREADLEFEAVKVDLILRQLTREAKVKVVILDACRDNPLAAELSRSMSVRSRSLGNTSSGMGAIDAQSASGTMIAFATAPGTTALDGTGNHSPFTEALLQHIETPGIDIDVMMKRVRGQVARVTGERQQPWTNSSLTAEVFLNGQTAASAAQVASAYGTAQQGDSQPRTAAPSFDPMQVEFAVWQAADQGKSPADYKAYLTQYPNGKFADIARNRLASLAPGSGPAASSDTRGLGGTVAADEAAEASLDMNDGRWRQVQRRLTELGHSTKGIDGEPGQGTRAAIRQWQAAQSIPQTGFLNRSQYDALLGAAAATASAVKSDAPAKSRAASRNHDSDDEPRRSRRSDSDGDSGPSARKAGEFLGGVVRGATGLRLPF